jgi:Domain of unknown function (DUF7008)/Eco57I restriction-modification methylase
MIDRDALLRDLKAQVRLLEEDLRRRRADVPEFAESQSLEWDEAKESGRTASTYEGWLDDRVTQAAVAWALATVFIRFCEDNELIDLPVLAGPGQRLAIASERQQEYFAAHPEKTDRDWILQGVRALSVSKVAAGLFDEAHNPMWTITISHEAAKDLLAFWRRRAENGEIIHDFTDPEWNTRFLGDLYQHLSEAARKAYALLQTPEFVEEFILSHTLDPAIEEFGLTPDPSVQRPDLPRLLRVIDPTCGSGHFLLGSFHRLLAKWEGEAPDADRWEQISRALSSVHGVDKNPFAAAIARFRMLIAAMNAGGEKLLLRAPEFPINIAVGDSLLHGRGAPGIQGEFDLLNQSGSHTHTYVTEDVEDYIKSVDMLGVGSYHVVVGNPPYITVKDKQESENYRKAYPSCYGEYGLSIPFAERFFKLAIPGSLDGRGAGYAGQITSNVFAKRDSGQKLIQEFFPKVDLTHIIDTSGVHIPGHGTPTIILIGRRRYAVRSSVRVVRSVNGDPGSSVSSTGGPVWTSIITNIDRPGVRDAWISVDDLDRNRYFSRHPWILEAGGLELVEHLDGSCQNKLSSIIQRIGYFGDSHADQVFLWPAIRRIREIRDVLFGRDFCRGPQIRDWEKNSREIAILPYDEYKSPLPEDLLTAEFIRLLWPFRSELWNRTDFNGRKYLKSGRSWWEWHQLPKDSSGHRWVIAYSDMSVSNRFVLDEIGAAYNRHAPIVRLRNSALEEDYFDLLGVLNSSTVCFWLQQVCYNRGEGGGARVDAGYSAMGSEGWKNNFEFDAGKLLELPLPASPPGQLARDLAELGLRLSASEPTAVCAEAVPTRKRLDAAKTEHEQTLSRMIALQEELDWEVYRNYRLLDSSESAELIAEPGSIPDLRLGERSFEIVLARRMARGEIDTQWFQRHRSVPITDIPERWPRSYKTVIAKRIEAIEDRQDLALVERPECKRRWQSEPWEIREREALSSWLIDRCENRALWYVANEWGRDQPKPMTVNRLADRLRTNVDVVSVARLLAGADADLAEVLVTITADQHVPYLAQFRYTTAGLRKRIQWEDTWNKQRDADAKNVRLDIAVPPKYKKEDFVRQDYWQQRGKLDVPKERFISYPAASPDGDGSLLIGWAGWDHREQAHALMTLIDERGTRDGWGVEKLTPLIAGLAEVMPWVRQWYADIDPGYGTSPAQAYDTYLEDQRVKYSLVESDLLDWSPPAPSRRRRRGSSQEKARPADVGQQPDPGDQDEGTE